MALDSSLWKINSTQASTFAKELQLALVNQAADSFSFNVDGQSFDSAELYSYGDDLSLYKGETRWFKGVVISGPRFGSPSAERHDYSCAGLWWYLEQCAFEQSWQSDDYNYSADHVILGVDADDEDMTVGAVIAEILDDAIDKGAPFTYDADELDTFSSVPPEDEQTSITHGEAIRKMLRWYPDTATWFDYSADTPVLHFVRRSSADAVSYNCTDGETGEQIDIRSRGDLQKTGVIINYEVTDTIDGENIRTLTQDIHPSGTTTGFDVASFTIPMSGYQKTTQSVEIETTPFEPNNFGEEAFWQHWVPELADKTDLEITEVGGSGGTLYDNVLLSGQLPEWTSKSVSFYEVEAKIAYTDENETRVAASTYRLVLPLTDAETQKYTRTVSYTTAESISTGLAESLHNSLSVLHWQGSFALVEEEVTGGIHPGNTLNLSGGLTAWASMKAAVQQVDFDIDAGRTTISFGPPEHLGAQDSITLLNANRTRITRYSNSRSSSTAGDEVDTGGATPNTQISGGAPRFSKLVIKDGDTGKTITLDTGSIGARKVLVGATDGNSATFDYPTYGG